MEKQEENNIVEVTTINGVTADKNNCRRIGGDYYIIGDINVKDSGDCYYINDKYYRIETGYITYDYELQVYVVKNSTNLINGVVEVTNNELIYGYFTPNKFNNVYVFYNGSKIISLSSDIFEATNKFREQLKDGIFYDIKDIPAINFNRKIVPKSDYKRSLPYNCKDVIKDFTRDYNNNNISINNTIERYGSAVRDLSFGLEFETTKGFIPDRLSKPLGLIPLRDGSITGIEYVTIPVSGKKGLQSIVNSCNLLKARTSYDDSCALHLHVGGIPRTMEFILALYKTLVHVQDDVYKMFPLYKKYNFGVKQNDYTKQLPTHTLINQMDAVINKDNIVENFDILFTYLSQGVNFKANYNTLDDVDGHPSDPRGNRKWQVGTRYLWANMIPLIFDNKQTVEFRIHTPTFEVNKVLNYVVMCSSIINFVKDNTNSILSNYRNTLQNKNLYSIIEKGIHSGNDINNDDRYRLYSAVSRYLRNRVDSTYSQNCRGIIKGDESDISGYSGIDWNKPVIKKVSTTKDIAALSSDGIKEFLETEQGIYNRIERVIRARRFGADPQPLMPNFGLLDNIVIGNDE